ncbi:MAG TPA: hypothetical protein VH120_07330, partial [Gemmataceae bacterium]|nr:hypothetical protein [Gemmataceae bacterium]
MNDHPLVLDCQRDGRKVRVTARVSGHPVHLDIFDLANAKQRAAFVKAVQAKLPAADPDELDAELLRAAAAEAPPAPTPAAGDELDVSRVRRPELFHISDVSGMTVPVVMLSGGKPVARWHLCLRWRDGRRESRPMANDLDLSAGDRLWFHPTPADPAVHTSAGWSPAARRTWLAGGPA